MKRDWLERFIQIGTSEMYGSVDHATTEDEPIKPTSPYAASKVAFDMYLTVGAQVPEVPDEHHSAFERLLPRPVTASRDPEGGLCGLEGRKAAAARRRPRGEIVYSCPRSWPRHPSRRGKGAARNDVQCRSRHCRHRSARSSSAPPRRSACHSNNLCEVTGDRLGQDSRYWLDSSAIKRDVGWEPQIGWDEGLAEMVAWGRKYFLALKNWPTDYTLRGVR